MSTTDGTPTLTRGFVRGAASVHQVVSLRAPGQEKLKWMWLVCGLLPRYGCQPASGRFAIQMRRFQIMYM
ncbi:hypothetical protein ADK78_13325, partial [Kitasatospora aureofaciens]